MHIHSSLLFAALTSAAVAQVTTPVGYGATEGNAVFFNFAPARRLQCLDGTQANTAAVFTRFSLRRDGGSATNTQYGARTVDLQVVLGPANLAQVSADFNANLVGSTVVYALRSTNMPDWTNAPISQPAPFDFNLTLDAPFVHVGGPLLWELEHLNSTVSTQTVLDRQYNAYASLVGTDIVGSVGCTPTGGSAPFTHTTTMRNGGAAAGSAGMYLQVSATNAPTTAPVLLSIDAVDSAISLPFLCATLHAQPTVLIPVGVSGATGTLPSLAIGFPHNPRFVGASLVTQLVSVDAGQAPPLLPIVLSNGRTSSMPGDPTALCSPACYAFATSPATTGTFNFGGSLVAELQ